MADPDVEALVRKLGTRTGTLVARYCAPLEARIAHLEEHLRETADLLREAVSQNQGRRP